MGEPLVAMAFSIPQIMIKTSELIDGLSDETLDELIQELEEQAVRTEDLGQQMILALTGAAVMASRVLRKERVASESKAAPVA